MVVQSQFIEMSKHGCSKRQLGSLFCSIRNGANIKQGVKSGGFPITRIETIAEGYVDRSKMGYAGIEDNSYSGYYLQNYDILMSHINSMKHIGKTAIYRQSIGETVIHGMNLLCLRLKEGVANPMYVLYLLQSDDIRTEIRLISKQAVNQASFTVSDLKTIEITLPSMSVQNQFEVVVNQADKSKFDGLKSQFIEQFSDERWPLKSISELCDIVTDGEHQTPRRVDSGIYLLSARNVKNQELSFDDVDYIDEQEYQRIAKRIEPQENDVLISCSGSVGRTCVVPKGIRFQLVRSVALLRFKPLVDPLFMSYQMAMPYVQSQIETLKSQTSQANLFQGNIKKIQVIVPSKEEQKRFIIVVRKADKSKYLS